MGARVVHVETKGYGIALMGGIAAGRGKFIIMADADNSYDFGELFKFVEKLQASYDLVWPAVWRRHGDARSNALPASVVRKSHVFFHGPTNVLRSDP
jgi:glycosyltransferase involved in cell wall biosynthesis